MLGSSRRFILLPAVLAISLATALGCSKTDDARPNGSTRAGATVSGTAGSTTLSNTNPDARLAQAKTIAVGFFEAQAVNDWEKALKRSSGGAELTIKWAQAVNTIAAANGTPYQVPSVTAPNVRVQLDELAPSGDSRWAAKGFVELSFRPGPVAPATTVSAPNTPAPQGAAAGAFVVDLLFTGDGDALKLDDYRLDDTPYPVSQLFMALNTPMERAGGVAARLTLAHRDLDGSVLFVLVAKNEKDQPITLNSASFLASAPLVGGTSVPTSKAGTLAASPTPVKGDLLADVLKPATDQAVLVVLGGAFPGSAGTLTLTPKPSGAPPATPTTPAPPGTIPATEIKWTIADWPALTPRPLRTVGSSTTTSSSTTSTTSTTSTSAPATNSTVSIPNPPTVTAPTTTTSGVSRPSTTTVSSTTSSTTVTVPR